MDTNRDIEFLFEIGTMRNCQRAWRQMLGMDCANNIEHSYRVAFLALLIAQKEGVKSDEMILKMALVHDLAEARVSDLNYVQKVYTKGDEDRAAADMFDKTSFGNLHEAFKMYEKRESIEAKIVKDADNLDVDVEIQELRERGSLLPEKWMGFRRQVRDEKLYTESAKALWDEIEKADPASWHLTTNKWKLIPSAGK